MPEGNLHTRARKVLRPGDLVGQPIGDPFQIAKIKPGVAYRGDEDTKGLRADLVVVTNDEQEVHIEFEVTHEMTASKLERIRDAGVHRVLLIKLSNQCSEYSNDQLRAYIAKGNVFLKGPGQQKTHMWLYMATSPISRSRRESTDPAEGLNWLEEASEELVKHPCFVVDCHKRVMSAQSANLRGEERRSGRRDVVPVLPIYACEDHAIQASLAQLPQGAYAGWWVYHGDRLRSSIRL